VSPCCPDHRRYPRGRGDGHSRERPDDGLRGRHPALKSLRPVPDTAAAPILTIHRQPRQRGRSAFQRWGNSRAMPPITALSQESVQPRPAEVSPPTCLPGLEFKCHRLANASSLDCSGHQAERFAPPEINEHRASPRERWRALQAPRRILDTPARISSDRHPP